MSKTIKDPPKETKELKILRLAFKEAMDKKYGNKPEPPSETTPAPKTKAKPEPTPEPTTAPKSKAKPEPPPETTPAPKTKATPKPQPIPHKPVKQVGVELIINNDK